MLGLATVVVAVAAAGPRLSRSAVTSPEVERILWGLGVLPANGARGSIRGSVNAADRQTGRIRLGWGLGGLLSVPIVVTTDTRIVVGHKEGGFGDIVEAQDVVAAYEVRAGIPEATRVEIVGRGVELGYR